MAPIWFWKFQRPTGQISINRYNHRGQGINLPNGLRGNSMLRRTWLPSAGMRGSTEINKPPLVWGSRITRCVSVNGPIFFHNCPSYVVFLRHWLLLNVLLRTQRGTWSKLISADNPLPSHISCHKWPNNLKPVTSVSKGQMAACQCPPCFVQGEHGRHRLLQVCRLHNTFLLQLW